MTALKIMLIIIVSRWEAMHSGTEVTFAMCHLFSQADFVPRAMGCISWALVLFHLGDKRVV